MKAKSIALLSAVLGGCAAVGSEDFFRAEPEGVVERVGDCRQDFGEEIYGIAKQMSGPSVISVLTYDNTRLALCSDFYVNTNIVSQGPILPVIPTPIGGSASSPSRTIALAIMLIDGNDRLAIDPSVVRLVTSGGNEIPPSSVWLGRLPKLRPTRAKLSELQVAIPHQAIWLRFPCSQIDSLERFDVVFKSVSVGKNEAGSITVPFNRRRGIFYIITG